MCSYINILIHLFILCFTYFAQFLPLQLVDQGHLNWHQKSSIWILTPLSPLWNDFFGGDPGRVECCNILEKMPYGFHWTRDASLSLLTLLQHLSLLGLDDLEKGRWSKHVNWQEQHEDRCFLGFLGEVLDVDPSRFFDVKIIKLRSWVP